MLISRSSAGLWLALLAAALPACSPSGDLAPTVDCDAAPLAKPVLRVGESDMPPGTALHISGAIKALSLANDGRLTLTDIVHGDVTIHWKLPVKLPLDLKKGQVVKVAYRRTEGFEGSARGLSIRDDEGVVLLVDDGDYGNALTTEELAPFAIAQEDARCRNRKNQPGDLNNFLLVVTAGENSVKLINGERQDLAHGGRTFVVQCTRSTARVGDVVWTDAPYEFRSFIIARRR